MYVVDQNLVSTDNNNITQVDSKIAELTKEVQDCEEFVKKAENELKELKSTISAKEAAEKLAAVCHMLYSWFNSLITNINQYYS